MNQKETPQRHAPELIFGLVGATGTDLDLVTNGLTAALEDVNYRTVTIHVIELLSEFQDWATWPVEAAARILAKMNAGDDFCTKLNRGDAIARLALGKVRAFRKQLTGNNNVPSPATAYILRSLKRQEEVDFLRTVYGDNFLLVGAFASRKERVTNLAKKIGEARFAASTDQFRSEAEKIVQRDLDDHSKKWGQHVGDTFPLADVFVDATDPAEIAAGLDRFIKLLFRYPFHTPRRDEYGLFHAQSAALRSGALSRQVGAAIMTAQGAIIAVGTNDVPKAGGGQYWETDTPDKRDHVEGSDSSDTMKHGMIAELIQRLADAKWLTEEKARIPAGDLARQALTQREPLIFKGTLASRVIEYGRTIHAEMSAIVDAASRGVPVAGAVLYTTTYPCHNCARHIVAAGIKHVIYLEPYPKSLTTELHQDSMINDEVAEGKVGFCAFVGIAPRKYMTFFEMPERKDPQGRVVKWIGRSASPRGRHSTSYLKEEIDTMSSLVTETREAGLSAVPEGADQMNVVEKDERAENG